MTVAQKETSDCSSRRVIASARMAVPKMVAQKMAAPKMVATKVGCSEEEP
jgi:hypothetical protein